MCEILVAVNPYNYTHPDPDTDLSTVYKRGYPVVVFDDGHSWGAEEGLPKFVIVKIPGIAKDVVVPYLSEWKQIYNHVEVSHNNNADTYRWSVVAAASGISVSGKGKIKKAQVQGILEKLSATNVSEFDNEVQYDMGIFSAMTTDGFWEKVLTGAVITELSYVKQTGIHTVQIDYSSTKLTASEVEIMIIGKGGAIVSNSGGVVVFTINRTSVLSNFQNQVKHYGEKTIGRRKYYLNSGFVQSIIDAGGVMTISSSTFVGNAKNLLNE